MIDYWKLAKGYKKGDYVQKFIPGVLMNVASLSPFLGTVVDVHPGIGFLDIQWPFGTERVSAEEVVKVNPKLSAWLPGELDQVSSWEQNSMWRKSAGQNMWADKKLPPGFYLQLSQSWQKKASEVESYDYLWHKFSSQGTSDSLIKEEVAKFYRVASKLVDFRINQHVHKTAAYWVAQNRQYRITSDELKFKAPNCPKCATKMKRTTYKMDKGARVRLFACPKDLFLLKSDAILGPQGEPLGW